MTGCNHGAKNTLMMNYLPDAKRHGAEIYTHAIVTHVSPDPDGEGWLVHYRMAGSAETAFDAPPNFIRASLVVLGAGALGSTGILLRSREKGLPVSSQLGHQFTGNGDVVGWAYGMADRVNGVGTGASLPPKDDPVGPCITGCIDLRDPNKPLDEGMIIEEGSLAGAMAPLLPAAFGFSETLWGEGGKQRVSGWLRESWYKFSGMSGGAYRGKMAHTQTLLVMSHDGAAGKVELHGDVIRVNWPNAGLLPENMKVHEELKRITIARSGTYVRNPIWSDTLGYKIITVHPLGGCPMGASGATGVVDHKQRVYAGDAGAVHEGLYVMDGSVVRRSVGVNPLMTISAFAERACAIIAKERGWTIDYGFGLTGIGPVAIKGATGLRFTETMRGVLAPGANLDFEAAAAAGEAQGLECHFTLTVEAEDLNALVDDATHFAGLSGILVAKALSDKPLSVSDGRFHVFVLDPDDPASRLARYRMRLSSEEGKVYWFEGYKRMRDDPGVDLWTDITTLFVTVYEGENEQAPVFGRGILTIHLDDLATQLMSIRIESENLTWPERIRGLKSLGKLLKFMGGEMWTTYGFGKHPPASGGEGARPH
jgi:cholesterol oxidase